ncbi:hypothetical protein RchiOBHm_Chr7g0204401 [Rosa chinensis]|uniref:Uncharacterized protein n=1 Tax=Rosa chinensis TaxID=74649 RepID=A0A2P6P8N9_ROSCH|nr:hypothetical protein RchiOBHm_Chr7g0204401 [Rosa chinensis]
MHVAYQTDCALLLWEQTVPLLENIHLLLLHTTTMISRTNEVVDSSNVDGYSKTATETEQSMLE